MVQCKENDADSRCIISNKKEDTIRMRHLKPLLVTALIITILFSSLSFLGFTSIEKPKQLEHQALEIRLPIIMYHNILNHRKGKYVVSQKQLESDFRAILDNGFTPVFMSQVIDWVDGKGTLPDKPIVITFDDGHYNNLHYGLPLAKELGIKFMINPVTGFSKFSVESGDHSNPNYSHITWEQMGEAHKSGHIEFGNHTHSMHKFKPRFGIMRMGGEDDTTYASNIRDDIQKSQQHFVESGVPAPLTFAYPFGKYSTSSRGHLIDMGFRALLTCNEWINTIRQGDPASLHKLGRFNRDGHLSTEQVLTKLVYE